MFAQYKHVRIASVAAAVPHKNVCIEDITKPLPQDMAFKVKRTAKLAGLHKRHLAELSMSVSDLGGLAAETALSGAGWDPESVDCLFFVTNTSDTLLPAAGYIVHQALSLRQDCVVTDVTASCSGMVQGIWCACPHLLNEGASRILIVAADIFSKTMRPDDIGNAILFGDAAGAVALEYDPSAENEVSFCLKSFPDVNSALSIRREVALGDAATGFYMDGAVVADFTQLRVPCVVESFLEHLQKSIADIDLFCMHQPNIALLHGIGRMLGIPSEKLPNILGEYGNCSSASIPVLLSHCMQVEKRKALETLWCGFGGGFAVAAMHTNIAPEVCQKIKYL